MYNLGKQFMFDIKKGICNNSNTFKGNRYRITILTERVIRIEYNKNGLFVDAPSEFALNRSFPKVKMNVVQDDKYLEIETDYFKLSYTKENDIAPSNLKISLKNTESSWYYKHPEVKTNDALFTCFDEKSKYEKGIYSREGFSSIDDSKTLLLDVYGNYVKRPSNGIDIYVFMYNDDYDLALKDYYAITGRPQLIPRYALGNWWSKNYEYNDISLNKLFDRFNKEGIPISILLLNKDWHITDNKYKTGYTFNTNLIKNPNLFIDSIHKRGIRIGVNINPIEGVYPHEAMYNKVCEYIKSDTKVIPFMPFDPKFLDVFMKVLLHPLENIGIDFFWLDYDIKNDLSLYLLNHYMFLDSGRNESKRSMLLSKNAKVSTHRYGIITSGNSKVGYDTLNTIPYINSSASNIGVSWWSHDIGGFKDGMEDGELYLRSVQLGCFSPIFRISVDKGRYYKREPWRWDVKTFEIVKEYMQLRHRLVPYIYSEAYKYYNDGRTIVTPLYHKYKDMYYDTLYKNEYLFGTEIVVCPLVNKKDTLMNRVVHKFYLPEGTWYSYKDGKKYPGDRSYVSFFKDEDYPVFVKSGAIIPIDSNITNSLNVPKNLEIQIFPGKSNSYLLYEDDGVSNLYKSGYFLKTLIDYNYQENNYTVIIRPIEGKSGIIPDTRNYKIRFRNTIKTSTVLVNFDGTNIEPNCYEDGNDFIVEVNNVKTIGQLSINCKGHAIEIDSVRLINEEIDEIISDLEVETSLKDRIASILFSNLPIKKKRIQIKKLKKHKLESKFIKMFLRLLEYIEQI